MMNFFRISGDLCHLLSFIILIFKLHKWRSARGISLKTQELLLVVFCTRYLDLFTDFHSWYNTIMKIIYIACTAYIVYLIRIKDPWRGTYDGNIDSLNHVLYLVAPCLLLAIILPDEYTVLEILWSFSIYLEAVAIMPQLFVLHRYAALEEYGAIEKITADYVFALGSYRALYLLNWIYRVFTEPHYSAWLVWLSGMVQTLLFADFAYYYVISKMKGEKMSIPVTRKA